MALRTILGLFRGKTRAGRDCLRGNLHKTLILRDDDGNEREYPAGTFIMLLKNDKPKNDKSPHYQLLAAVDDDQADDPQAQHAEPAPTAPPTAEPPPPPSYTGTLPAAQQQRWREHREATGDDEIPF